MHNPARAFIACILLLTLGVATLFGQTGLKFDVSSLDKNTPPCVDFYQYVNGGWIASHPIPAAFPSWGTSNELVERNRDVLHDILETAAKRSATRTSGAIIHLYRLIADHTSPTDSGQFSLKSIAT